jgi:hypothetical protein
LQLIHARMHGGRFLLRLSTASREMAPLPQMLIRQHMIYLLAHMHLPVEKISQHVARQTANRV